MPTQGEHPVRRVLSRLSRIDPFDLASGILLIVLIALVVATADSYAISNDEEVQQRYGELILQYYASGFTDKAVFQFRNLYLYGGLFDVMAVGLQHLLPLDPYAIRHFLCAAFGISGVVAVWATARLIAGSAAGLLAATLLVSCGSFYGTIFNHTKDIPFAALTMGAVYFLLRMGRDIADEGRSRTYDLLLFAILLGAAAGIRVTGVALLIYAGVMVLLHMPVALSARSKFNFRDAAALISHQALLFVPGLVLAYVIMIAAWPWAAISPLNPLRAIGEFKRFSFEISTLLAGQQYTMSTVPAWYVPLYFLVKMPIPLMLGVAMATVLVLRPKLLGVSNVLVAQQRRDIGLLLFVVAFPLFCQVVGQGPAFSGLRHFTFLILPLAVLGGVAGVYVLRAIASRHWAVSIGAAAALCAGIAIDVRTLVQLHPYEYLYFNAFVGGLPGAAGRYDTDYWANMIGEGVDDLGAYLDRTEPSRRLPGRYYVAICSEPIAFEKEAAQDRRLILTDDWDLADFYISPTHMRCDRLLEGRVVATISRLGVIIGVVKDRRGVKSRMATRVLPPTDYGHEWGGRP